MPKRSHDATQETRTQILRRGLELASIEGLSGVTIGRLSDAISMSKSGLFAHFGSKEELHLAIVEAAGEAFDREVVAGLTSTNGIARLAELADAWIRYLQRGP